MSSYRITLRISESGPDDLEIRRFLQALDERGLARQGWLKRAMVLGFRTLEQQGVLEEETRNPHRVGYGKVRFRGKKQPPATRSAEPPVAKAQGAEPQAAHAPAEPSSGDPWYHADPPPEAKAPAAPESSAAPVAVESEPTAAVRPTPTLPQESSRTPPGDPAPSKTEPSRTEPFMPEPAMPEPAMPGPAAPEPLTGKPESGMGPAGHSPTPGTSIQALLDRPEMQFSEDTLERVRRLAGNFGKGFDG